MSSTIFANSALNILHILSILFQFNSMAYRITRRTVFRSSTIIPSASMCTS